MKDNDELKDLSNGFVEKNSTNDNDLESNFTREFASAYEVMEIKIKWDDQKEKFRCHVGRFESYGETPADALDTLYEQHPDLFTN